MSLETAAPFSICGKYVTELHKKITLKQSLVSCLIIYWWWQQGEYLITIETGFQIENKFILEVTGGEKGGGGSVISSKEIFIICQFLMFWKLSEWRNLITERLQNSMHLYLKCSWACKCSSCRKQEFGRVHSLKQKPWPPTKLWRALLIWGLWGAIWSLLSYLSFPGVGKAWEIWRAKPQRNKLNLNYNATFSCSGENLAQNLLQGIWLLGTLNLLIFVYQQSPIEMSVKWKGFWDAWAWSSLLIPIFLVHGWETWWQWFLKGPGDAERKPKTIIHPESPKLLVPWFSHLLMGNNKRIVRCIMHVSFLAVGSQWTQVQAFQEGRSKTQVTNPLDYQSLIFNGRQWWTVFLRRGASRPPYPSAPFPEHRAHSVLQPIPKFAMLETGFQIRQVISVFPDSIFCGFSFQDHTLHSSCSFQQTHPRSALSY